MSKIYRFDLSTKKYKLSTVLHGTARLLKRRWPNRSSGEDMSLFMQAEIVLSYLKLLTVAPTVSSLNTLKLPKIDTYIHTYMHTYMHTYIHTHTHTHTHTYIHTYTHTYIHAYIHT